MRQCEKCGKSHKMGGTRKLLRGKYNPTNWKQKKANLQRTRLWKPGKQSLLCTQCIKTITKDKAKT